MCAYARRKLGPLHAAAIRAQAQSAEKPGTKLLQTAHNEYVKATALELLPEPRTANEPGMIAIDGELLCPMHGVVFAAMRMRICHRL